jgi:hypothetical protein
VVIIVVKGFPLDLLKIVYMEYLAMFL